MLVSSATVSKPTRASQGDSLIKCCICLYSLSVTRSVMRFYIPLLTLKKPFYILDTYWQLVVRSCFKNLFTCLHVSFKPGFIGWLQSWLLFMGGIYYSVLKSDNQKCKFMRNLHIFNLITFFFKLVK